MKTLHVFVKGDVIGVGFRAWVRYHAKKLGVSGWVKNVFDNPQTFGPDGGVEALLQGEEQAVNRLLELIKQGSPISKVSNVDTKEEKSEVFDSFSIIK